MPQAVFSSALLVLVGGTTSCKLYATASHAANALAVPLALAVVTAAAGGGNYYILLVVLVRRTTIVDSESE